MTRRRRTAEPAERPARVGPTPERARHDRLREVETFAGGERAIAKRVNHKDPLDWLRSRSLINEVEFIAGKRLASDWRRARYTPKPPPSLDRIPNIASGPEDVTGAVLDARDRIRRALRVLGVDQSRIAVRVAVEGLTLRALEQVEGWPRGSGLPGVRLCLARLAEWYGV